MNFQNILIWYISKWIIKNWYTVDENKNHFKNIEWLNATRGLGLNTFNLVYCTSGEKAENSFRPLNFPFFTFHKFYENHLSDHNNVCRMIIPYILLWN